jgi:cation:H+ antiporter
MNHVLQFPLAAFSIIAAGVLLTRSADRLADETGLDRSLVGSILLAGATSLPELMVDVNAVLLNQPDLAVGDLLGSSLFNLFILAAVDSVFRHPRRAFSGDFVHHAQTAALSINLTALVGIAILSGVSASFAGVGVFSWVIALVYLVGFRMAFQAAGTEVAAPGKASASRRRDGGALVRSVIGFLVGTAVILVAAPYLVASAEQLARVSGLGQTFIGTTLVALSTSLPELVATVAAYRMGKPDLALGNVFGSNTFNVLLLFPLDAFYSSNLLSSVRREHAFTAFCVIAVSSVAVMGQVSRKRERTRMWEPSSELVLILTLGFFFLLFRAASGTP